MQRDALRYSYLAGDVSAVAITYNNLGNYLRRHARRPVPALASHLAAALIHALSREDTLAAESVWEATTDLREFGTAAVPAP